MFVTCELLSQLVGLTNSAFYDYPGTPSILCQSVMAMSTALCDAQVAFGTLCQLVMEGDDEEAARVLNYNRMVGTRRELQIT